MRDELNTSEELAVTPLPAFNDNYLWLLSRDGRAAIVDPGDPAPVMGALAQRGLRLVSILVTHHHGDHTGGVMELKRSCHATVYGPAAEAIDGLDHRLKGGDRIEVLGLEFRVIDVPGHTRGHIAYYTDTEKQPWLFCGDTLFGGGCGRLFEGTAAQMLSSLDALAALPATTQVCCAHEYTVANLRFGLAVEPASMALQERARSAATLRAQGQPTLPSTIGLERATNPFLRSDVGAVRAAAEARSDRVIAASDRLTVFATLRGWKDVFR
jgi:hydroxyacylglutathione hydrolase